jgi:hypothetical protein
MIKILNECCSPAYLDCLKEFASNTENWNLKYPRGEHSIADKFLKLDIIDVEIKQPFLAGLAMGLLIQIQKACGYGLFIPSIHFCGISIKDKHRPDYIHTDHSKEEGFVKILGIINSDWKEEWGGGFFYKGTSNYIKPTSFCIFDPSEDHAAAEIITDKRRFAIDFTVFKDQQSLKRYYENEN